MSDSNYVIVNAIDLRQNMGDLINRVFYQGLTVFIKRRGKVVAKLIASDKSEVPAEAKEGVPQRKATAQTQAPVNQDINIVDTKPQVASTANEPTASQAEPEKEEDTSISNDSLEQLKEELRRAGYDPSYVRE